jgi:hypothetical protein
MPTAVARKDRDVEVMSRFCCRPCRIRFAPAVYLNTCPECGCATEAAHERESLIGLRLFDPLQVADVLPEAVSVSLPEPTGEWT